MAANWVTQDVLRDLNADNVTVDAFPITAEILGTLLKWITSDRLTNKSARDVYALLKEQAGSGKTITMADAETAAAEREIVRDTGAVEAAARAAMEKFGSAVDDVRNGKLQAVGPMIGFIMKQVSGADPKSVRETLLKLIQSDDATT